MTGRDLLEGLAALEPGDLELPVSVVGVNTLAGEGVRRVDDYYPCPRLVVAALEPGLWGRVQRFEAGRAP